MAHRATVARGFVTGMLSALPVRGVEASAMLRRAGIEPAALRPADARVPLDNYAALYNAVVRALDDEGFALFARPLPPGTFEFLCRAIVGGGTLEDSLERACRFLRFVLPDLRVDVRRHGTHAELEITEAHPLRRSRSDPRRIFAFEWLLRLIHGLACWLVGRGLALDRVRFPYPRPIHAADYALVYTERASFGGDTLVATFDAALLELPARRDAADVTAFLDGAPGKITMLYRRDREIVRRVREMLSRDLGSSPSLDAVAAALNVSPRTLHRRLHDEGSSFRAVKDEVRREIALARLKRDDASIAAIASDLGYSEPSAFFRAFQGWTGEAPSVYRRRTARR